MLPSRLLVLSGIISAIIVSTSAHAQTCKERFITAATVGNGDGDYRQIVTQKIHGSPVGTVSEFIMKGQRHWLTKPIEPKGTGWTLLYEGAMYSSLDEGASWREIAKFDETAAENARKQQKSDVKGVVDLKCDTEQVEGQTFDRIHGKYEVTVGFKSTQVHTYWINPNSGLIELSKYETLSPSFKSTVSQKMIPFAGAELPTP